MLLFILRRLIVVVRLGGSDGLHTTARLFQDLVSASSFLADLKHWDFEIKAFLFYDRNDGI